jgi:hypothetical protein
MVGTAWSGASIDEYDVQGGGLDEATMTSSPGARMKLRTLFLFVVGIAHGASANVFGPGERVKFEVSVLGIPAGTANISVGSPQERFGRTVWPLVCVGRTSHLAAIYPIDDRFISYWDPEEQNAAGSEFYVDENRRRRRERYWYSLDTKEAVVERQLQGEPKTERRMPMDERAMDLAAAAFRLRNFPLEFGDRYRIFVFTGVKTFEMTAQVEGKETIQSGLGPMEAIRVTMNGDFNGRLETRGLMTLFFSADLHHVPVRAEADFLFGSLRIDAVEFQAGRRIETPE